MSGTLNSQVSFWRKGLACLLCTSFGGWPALGQQSSIAPQRPQAPFLWRPYKAEYIPEVRLENSLRARDLVRAGKLYLTAQDAIALALENNIDIETARYNPLLLASQLRRVSAGGALAGVPSAGSQSGSVQSGQGVSGSQAAAGVSGVGGSSTNANSNTTITQIGPVTPVLDPTFQDLQTYTHRSQPQSNSRQSQVLNLIQNTRNYSEAYSQGFITGGTASLTYKDSYLNENAPSDLLNPSNGVSTQLSVQHNLLQGFGAKLNARNITVAKANLDASDVTFKAQVITVVANVLNEYYGLVAAYSDLRAKRTAVDVAQRFYEDNQKQVQIGTMAPLDVTTAESQLATSQQDLVVSETTLAQDQVSLKNLLSRRGLADPLLASVDIVPLDPIVVPEHEDIAPIKELIATAMKNRTDIATQNLNFSNAKVNDLGTSNAILPQLVGFASATSQGLSGTPKIVPFRGGALQTTGTAGASIPGFIPCPSSVGAIGDICEVSDKYFQGGISNALGQMVRRDFPSERAGVFFSATLRNRSAQADNNIDQLTLRQTELQNTKNVNQIAVTVSNAVIGIQQARVKYQAASKSRVLSEQLLSAEQKKFALGASTSFLVVQQQRDLTIAQSAETAALVAYSNARITLDQTVGLTLEQNHITVAETLRGTIARPSQLPAVLPSMPQ